MVPNYDALYNIHLHNEAMSLISCFQRETAEV